MLSRDEKLAQRRQETYDSLLHNLESYGICNVERCCSFGKTEIFIRYVRECGHNVLYLIDNIPTKDRLESRLGRKNVIMMTYAKLFRLSYEQFVVVLVDNKIKSAIFDESHTVGAPTVKKKWHQILKWCQEYHVNIIGGTATEIRCDSINVTTEFFNGHATFPYTIEDMVADDILTPPWYVEGIVESPFSEDEAKTLTEDERHVIYEATNVCEHLDCALNLSGNNRDYIKLIVFYPSIAEVEAGKDYWFNNMRAMFPDYELNIVCITSAKEHKKYVNSIGEYSKRPKAIDILLSVDMLNQGFHFPDLSGIVMMRSTRSPLIYTQQIGRCMTVDNVCNMFVLDLKGNFSSDWIVKNPLSGLFPKSGVGNILGTGHMEPERLRVHMTGKTRKAYEIIDKLNYARELRQAKALTTLAKTYTLYPDIYILDLADTIGIPERDIMYWLYDNGHLREEDMVSTYEYVDDINLRARLYHKYKDTHKH